MHPHRFEDELLSSWIVRTAHANRIKLQTFTTLALGHGAALWNRDVDRSANEQLLGELSAQTGSGIEDLRRGMLSAYEGTVFERHNPNGNTNWILPLGIYHRKRRGFGLQFCPLCLFFDPVPYYRLAWRMAFSTVCAGHGTMLHDRCPKCMAPIVQFRNDLGRRSGGRLGDYVSCWRCGFDLRRAPAYEPAGPDGKTLLALRSLVAFHDLGWWYQGGQHLSYAHLYFDALHHVVRFLPSPRGQPLLALVASQTNWHFVQVVHQGRSQFERRRTGDRHVLLVAALWLLDDWPNRFLGAAKAVGLTQSIILRGECRPFWFESEIRRGLDAGLLAPSSEEASHAAAFLARAGLEVSAYSVGRLIGTRHATAAKSYAQKAPAALGNAHLQRMIACLTAEIASLPPGRMSRLILQRDKVILRLLQRTGWSVKRILGLTVSDATWLASTPKAQQELPSEIAGMLLTYLRDTRRHLAGEASGDTLFIGWKRGAIGEPAWNLRFRRAKRSIEPS